MQGRTFIPLVYKKGSFTLRVGDPDRVLWQELRGIRIAEEDNSQAIRLDFI